jgi:hypothetical protein
VLDDESPYREPIADVGTNAAVVDRAGGIEEVERPDRIEGALEARIVRQRAVAVARMNEAAPEPRAPARRSNV